MRKLDLDRAATGGEGPLDLVQSSRCRYTTEAEPRDLVERRAGFGETRNSPRECNVEATRGVVATQGGFGAGGHQLRLDPLDPLGQGAVAEQRHSVHRLCIVSC